MIMEVKNHNLREERKQSQKFNSFACEEDLKSLDEFSDKSDSFKAQDSAYSSIEKSDSFDSSSSSLIRKGQ